MVNPCGDYTQLPYDCCVNRFGDGEYGVLKEETVLAYGLEYPVFREGRSDPPQLAEEDAVFENIDLVDDRGGPMTRETSRRADDELVVAEECKEKNDPYPYCLGIRLRKQRSSQAAACGDNNQTVAGLGICYETDGTAKKNCIQASYTQSAFIHVCGGDFANDPHCGTFLEVHRANGSPLDVEEIVLSEKKITTRETSGMMTTTVDMTYKGDESRVLCEFRETVIRVGSMVRSAVVWGREERAHF